MVISPISEEAQFAMNSPQTEVASANGSEDITDKIAHSSQAILGNERMFELKNTVSLDHIYIQNHASTIFSQKPSVDILWKREIYRKGRWQA